MARRLNAGGSQSTSNASSGATLAGTVIGALMRVQISTKYGG